MGVDIGNLVKSEETSLGALKGRKIAVDSLNVLYQFLSIIRQPNGTPLKDSKGRVTSHLSGLFYRTAKLIENEIKPCYVFDGKPPEFKKTTNKKRRERREEAKKKYEKALERGNAEEAKKYAQMSARVQDEMIEDSKKLLDAMGIPYVQAPSEGEAQAAFMNRKGDVWATSSQDFDALLFGSPILLRNIAITGKRKLPNKEQYVEVHPEILESKKVFDQLSIGRKQLVMVGILVGTDYNPKGIKGIGPKTAIDLVKKYDSMESIVGEVGWDFDISYDKIMDFFMDPPTNEDYSLEWRSPNEKNIKEFLCEEHDFSENRIDNSIERLENGIKSGTQKRLDSW
ncbi:MAG: flap endonuclease-1 [Candidatus Aenigmatarchaeota archaeon]